MKELVDRGGDPNPDFEFVPGVRRTAQEIARRAIVLCCVAASQQFPAGEFNEWLKREGLWGDLSPLEVDLLTCQTPTKRQRINASWRSEALQVMIWSIGKLESLPPLTELVKVPQMLDVMPERGDETAEFIASAQLRPDETIDDELEKIVQAHWQIRNEKFFPDEKAPEMIFGVVQERHWALAWIVNIDDEPWDETPLTT